MYKRKIKIQLDELAIDDYHTQSVRSLEADYTEYMFYSNLITLALVLPDNNPLPVLYESNDFFSDIIYSNIITAWGSLRGKNNKKENSY